MTVNKLTLPSTDNAVQNKINEIIDNLGGTVDQTYDPTSTNAQAGTAVAEALTKSVIYRDWTV